MLSGDNFSYWAKNLLLDWAEEDPVSQKEIDRNNAVYQIQDNRNPFIDHPEYACLIWGTDCSSSVNDVENIDLYVFPNPAKDLVSIDYHSYSNTTAIVHFYNALGADVFDCTIHNGTNKIDISSLPKSVYILSITNDKLKITKKIVKQ